MGILMRVEAREVGTLADRGSEKGKRSLSVSLDLGKTLVIGVIAVVVLVLSAILYLNKLDTAAQAFFVLGEAVVTGGLGVAIGENTGAREAERKLR